MFDLFEHFVFYEWSVRQLMPQSVELVALDKTVLQSLKK